MAIEPEVTWEQTEDIPDIMDMLADVAEGIEEQEISAVAVVAHGGRFNAEIVIASRDPESTKKLMLVLREAITRLEIVYKAQMQ